MDCLFNLTLCLGADGVVLGTAGALFRPKLSSLGDMAGPMGRTLLLGFIGEDAFFGKMGAAGIRPRKFPAFTFFFVPAGAE